MVVDPREILKPMSWYICLTRMVRRADVALASEITVAMLRSFAGLPATVESAADTRTAPVPPKLSGAGRRDFMPECRRARRLATLTKSLVVTDEHLRLLDSVWFAATTADGSDGRSPADPPEPAVAPAASRGPGRKKRRRDGGTAAAGGSPPEKRGAPTRT